MECLPTTENQTRWQAFLHASYVRKNTGQGQQKDLETRRFLQQGKEDCDESSRAEWHATRFCAAIERMEEMHYDKLCDYLGGDMGNVQISKVGMFIGFVIREQIINDQNLMMKDLDAAIKLSPKNVYAYFNKGNVYLLQGDYTSAISCYSKAIELKPDLGEAYYNRGLMYLRMGNKSLGVADLSQAGELGVLPSYNVLKRMTR